MFSSFNLTLILLISLVLFFILSFFSYRQFRQLIKVRGCSPKSLFKDFDQKMWMTLGLGLIFFSVYLTAIFLSRYLINQQKGIELFLFVYQEPTLFIYLGLFVFACMSLLIYLVRMLIKYLYLNRSRKNKD